MLTTLKITVMLSIILLLPVELMADFILASSIPKGKV